MDETKQHDASTSALLGRLDERTSHLSENQKYLAEALKDLQETQTTGTEKVLTAISTHAKEEEGRFEKHDARLKALENWKWYLAGALAVLGTIVALIIK